MITADINANNLEKPKITEEDLRKSEEIFLESQKYDGPKMFINKGTGIPDKLVIDYFKDTSIIVVARDGFNYQYGKKMEESDGV